MIILMLTISYSVTIRLLIIFISEPPSVLVDEVTFVYTNSQSYLFLNTLFSKEGGQNF